MKKNLKWILLTILIIFIIITIILFINYNNKNTNKNNELKEIMNREFFLKETTISNKMEVLFNSVSDYKMYLIIKENTFSYCNSEINECIEEKYTYKNKIFKVEENGTIGKGDYTIKIEDDILYMSRENNDRTITYTFQEPKG